MGDKLRWILSLFMGTLLSGMMALTPTGAGAAGALCVNMHGSGCYHSIQAAVDAAPDGGRINVAAGTYTGQVTISGKHLTLHGAGRQAVIDAAGANNGIYVNGADTSWTKISGFTVKNAGLEGMLLQDTSHLLVSHNLVTHNDQNRQAGSGGEDATCPGAAPFEQDDCGEGLHLQGVSYSMVRNNTVTDNAGGILLTDETSANHDNTVTRNVVRDNRFDCGITLPSHPAGFGPQGPLPGYGVYHNLISYNLSTGNGGAGVGLFAPTPGTWANENWVIGNTLTNNQLPGVAMHNHAPGTAVNGNVILWNQISNNAADYAYPAGTTGISMISDPGAPAMENTVIKYNSIWSEAYDVVVATSPTSLTLHRNNLLGSDAVGVVNLGSSTIDATWNYWGCPTGPGTAGCSSVMGAVDYTPWLTEPVSR